MSTRVPGPVPKHRQHKNSSGDLHKSSDMPQLRNVLSKCRYVLKSILITIGQASMCDNEIEENMIAFEYIYTCEH